MGSIWDVLLAVDPPFLFFGGGGICGEAEATCVSLSSPTLRAAEVSFSSKVESSFSILGILQLVGRGQSEWSKNHMW